MSRLEGLRGVDAVRPFLTERPRPGHSYCSNASRLDGTGGATAVVLAVLTSHDFSVGRVRRVVDDDLPKGKQVINHLEVGDTRMPMIATACAGAVVIKPDDFIAPASRVATRCS